MSDKTKILATIGGMPLEEGARLKVTYQNGGFMSGVLKNVIHITDLFGTFVFKDKGPERLDFTYFDLVNDVISWTNPSGEEFNWQSLQSRKLILEGGDEPTDCPYSPCYSAKRKDFKEFVNALGEPVTEFGFPDPERWWHHEL